MDGFPKSGKTSFIKKFIHSCRGKNLVVVNTQENKGKKKKPKLEYLYSDSEYHKNNVSNDIVVYEAKYPKGKLSETLEEIEENICFIDEEQKLIIFDGGDADRYLNMDINVFVIDPLPEEIKFYTLEKVMDLPDDMHVEICKRAGIDPKQIEPIPPEIEEELEKSDGESEEELIEISDEQAKELALIFGKAILDYTLQSDYLPLQRASVIIINRFKTNTEAEVNHTVREIENMYKKENVYRKPSIFICDLSESKQDSQTKAFNRIKRLIRRDQDTNSSLSGFIIW